MSSYAFPWNTIILFIVVALLRAVITTSLLPAPSTWWFHAAVGDLLINWLETITTTTTNQKLLSYLTKELSRKYTVEFRQTTSNCHYLMKNNHLPGSVVWLFLEGCLNPEHGGWRGGLECLPCGPTAVNWSITCFHQAGQCGDRRGRNNIDGSSRRKDEREGERNRNPGWVAGRHWRLSTVPDVEGRSRLWH